ncbi:hypothetical protein ACVCAH_24050 [Micromonospora sp. LZ34]
MDNALIMQRCASRPGEACWGNHRAPAGHPSSWSRTSARTVWAQRAVKELHARDLIYGQQGQGVFVAEAE